MQTSFKTRTFQGYGGHTLAYSEWGAEDGWPVLCLHGLTGNGFDFDALSPVLAEDGYRLICLDLAGRGRSDFLDDPLRYNYEQYRADIFTLLDCLDLNKPASIDLIGISLGGLLGIWLAGDENSVVRRLILDDVGPTVPQAALDFIYHVISVEYTFPSLEALEERMKMTRGLTWGPITDEQWVHMAAHNSRELYNGLYSYAYDPKIAEIFKSEPIGDADLWKSWDSIVAPTLVLRGGQSPILPMDILEAMRSRGPVFDYHEFEDCGHVPSLLAPNQIEVVRDWLYKTKP